MILNKKIVIELLKIFSLPIAILMADIFFLFFDVYSLISWIDMPMHFIGGIFIGGSYFLLLKMLQREGFLGETHNLLHFIFVISLVALTTIIWEFGEFTLDFIGNWGGLQPSLTNTMQDMFLGMVGGSVGCLIQRYFYGVKGSKN